MFPPTCRYWFHKDQLVTLKRFMGEAGPRAMTETEKEAAAMVTQQRAVIKAAEQVRRTCCRDSCCSSFCAYAVVRAPGR